MGLSVLGVSFIIDSPFIVVFKYRIISSFPNFDYEGSQKSNPGRS